MVVRSCRGSRKHILDLVESRQFVKKMNDLLDGTGLTLAKTDQHQPKGYDNDKEWTIRRFCRNHCPKWFDFECFDQWWVPDKYQNPQWDLLSTCNIDGRRGLLMVEAKANDNELELSGKQIRAGASQQAQANHARIGRCIAEAASDLSLHFEGIGLSRDTHYQLSNRVASAWKLAKCGFHVALLYLGFTGDSGVANVGIPIADNEHWQRVMGWYMGEVLPQHFPDQVVRFGNGGTMRILVKALPVIRISPPPSTRGKRRND